MFLQGKVRVSLKQFRRYLLETSSEQLKAQGYYMSLVLATQMKGGIMSNRCSAYVDWKLRPERVRGSELNRCKKEGKVTIDGKRYCLQHSKAFSGYQLKY